MWLDDGTRDIEGIRQLLQHPWIVDQFNDGYLSGSFEDKDEREPDVRRGSILRWSAEVEKFCSSLELDELGRDSFSEAAVPGAANEPLTTG